MNKTQKFPYKKRLIPHRRRNLSRRFRKYVTKFYLKDSKHRSGHHRKIIAVEAAFSKGAFYNSLKNVFYKTISVLFSIVQIGARLC